MLSLLVLLSFVPLEALDPCHALYLPSMPQICIEIQEGARVCFWGTVPKRWSHTSRRLHSLTSWQRTGKFLDSSSRCTTTRWKKAYELIMVISNDKSSPYQPSAVLKEGKPDEKRGLDKKRSSRRDTVGQPIKSLCFMATYWARSFRQVLLS